MKSHATRPVAPPRIVVVGSSNTDLTMRVPHLPRPGETVSGDDVRTSAGGKGANQAVAAARAGAAVSFVARVGADAYGRAAREQFARDGLALDYLCEDDHHASGVALILVAPDGSNSIAVSGGANLHLTPADVGRAGPACIEAKSVLAQLETPLETVQAAAELARAHGIPFLLNPAPAQPLPEALYRLVSVLTPNETETEQLTGVRVTDPLSATRAANVLLERGVQSVVITLGARGAWVATAAAQGLVPGFPVVAVDTTAAGDVFNGALAVALTEGQPLREAARFANAAAALAVIRPGAQESAPLRSAIEDFLARQPQVPAVAEWASTAQSSVEAMPLDLAVDPNPEPDPETIRRFADNYPLEQAHLFAPFWRGSTIHGESVVFVQAEEAASAEGSLLFRPEQILQVRSSDGGTTYEGDRDYTVDAVRQRLRLLPGSRIPVMLRDKLYAPKGAPRSIAHKVDAPQTNLFYGERWFPRVQVEVTYTHLGTWTGYTPSFAGARLPRTLARLRDGAGLTLCVMGDSISVGANASKTIPPFMPSYVALLQRGLQQAYPGRIDVVNFASPSTTAADGREGVDLVVGARPDLVVIAYGMNDTHARDADGYRRDVAAIIGGIRAGAPATEFIVVSPSRANPEWSWSPAEEFPRYAATLQACIGPGVALADLTALWTDLLARKPYLDLTGNGINHPNDFGHRLYAQVLLGLLVEPTAKLPG